LKGIYNINTNYDIYLNSQNKFKEYYILNIKEVLKDVPNLSKSEEERIAVENFINDDNNSDFLEQVHIISIGFQGWIELSSGKTVYISQPRSSAKEVGLALKNFSNRLSELNINTYENKNNKHMKEISEDIADEWNNCTK
jgi:hypothetical protein